MTEQELRDAYGMGKHERRQYEGGEGCSCGREWGHERKHTPQNRAPGCEFCNPEPINDPELIALTTEQPDRIDR